MVQSTARVDAHPMAHALLPILLLAVVWGCNWPVLKIGVTEIAPLTFRTLTLPVAALGMFLVTYLAGESLRIPRAWWGRLAVLAFFNIGGWNAFVLFGVQQLPAGRSAIIAYTMPIWATLIAVVVLRETLNRRKIVGLLLGTLGIAILLGDDIRHIRSAPIGALLILVASIFWACGTVLLRKWKPPFAQNALSGWMMLVGALPLMILAPFFDPHPMSYLATVSSNAWFAVAYNILLAGTVAHWTWFKLARTLPVAVSSLSSLPVPVVGVFAGMLFLGERPGTAEFVALALVLASLFTVLFQSKAKMAVPGTASEPSP